MKPPTLDERLAAAVHSADSIALNLLHAAHANYPEPNDLVVTQAIAAVQLAEDLHELGRRLAATSSPPTTSKEPR